jgi:UDP-N-acetylglucosamine 2-epimerase (non-hydrolysing)
MPDTGWRELVEAGWNKLASEENLSDVLMQEDEPDYPDGLYGDGNAAGRIVEVIERWYQT